MLQTQLMRDFCVIKRKLHYFDLLWICCGPTVKSNIVAQHVGHTHWNWWLGGVVVRALDL